MAQPVLIIASTGEKIITLLDPSNVAGTLLGVGSVAPTGLTPPAKWLGVASHVDGQTFVAADGVTLGAGYDGTTVRKVLVDSSGRQIMVVANDPDGTTVHAEGTAAAGTATAALPAVAAKFNYLTGFQISGLGATAATSVIATITDATWTLSFGIEVPAGVGKQTPLINILFAQPLKATTNNHAITLSVPSFGAGNTFVGVSIQGILK